MTSFSDLQLIFFLCDILINHHTVQTCILMQCMCEIIRNVQIAMYYGISSGACTSNIQEKIEKTKENWHKEIGSYTNPKSCFRNSYLNEDLYNTIQATDTCND